MFYRETCSDHAARAVQFVFTTASTKVPISGITYNTLNLCRSQENGARHFANNPYNYDETPEEYAERKFNQRYLIAKMMVNNHFILLQEIDFLLHSRDPVTEKTRNAVRELFYPMMQNKHWSIIRTQKTDNIHPMAIMYNADILKPKGVNYGLFKDGQQFRGFASEFIHLRTKQELTLVNLHLTQRDFRREILEYQYKQIQRDMPTIIGGDTNGILNKGPCGFFDGSGGIHQTHLGLNPKASVKKPLKRKTSYDGFFASPSKNSRVWAQGKAGGYFKLNKRSHCYQFKVLHDSQMTSKTSPLGHPILHYSQHLQVLEEELKMAPANEKEKIFIEFDTLYRQHIKDEIYVGFPIARQYATLRKLCKPWNIQNLPFVREASVSNRASLPQMFDSCRLSDKILLKFHRPEDARTFAEAFQKQTKVKLKPQKNCPKVLGVTLQELKLLDIDVMSLLAPLLQARICFQSHSPPVSVCLKA